jgi:hypothetical protein
MGLDLAQGSWLQEYYQLGYKVLDASSTGENERLK